MMSGGGIDWRVKEAMEKDLAQEEGVKQRCVLYK